MARVLRMGIPSGGYQGRALQQASGKSVAFQKSFLLPATSAQIQNMSRYLSIRNTTQRALACDGERRVAARHVPPWAKLGGHYSRDGRRLRFSTFFLPSKF